MDEIINYRDLPEDEKDNVLNQLFSIGFCPAWGGVKDMKQEMEKSVDGRLPQYAFVRRDGELIGYLFLIAQAEKTNRVFPWWAVDNSDELPLATDIRLLEYGVNLCEKAGCCVLAERLKAQIENHKKGIGRRPEALSR